MFRRYDWFLPPNRTPHQPWDLPQWEDKRTIVRVAVPLDEERVRKIVRQELADLIPVDVPDTPDADDLY